MNEKNKLEKKEDLLIKDSDIATVEALHDLLLKSKNFNFLPLARARKLTNKMYAIVENQKTLTTTTSKNILLEANDIIFERVEEKQREYGPIDESLEDASIVASMISNTPITIDMVYAVLIGLKTSRMRWNKKHDTFLDSIGYLAAFETYLRKQENE